MCVESVTTGVPKLAKTFQRLGSTSVFSTQPSCAAEVGASAVVTELAGLPADIRSDLARETAGELKDSSAPLLQTDAPTKAESEYATARFVRAMLINERWYVQFEVAMSAGVRTFAYVPKPRGRFERWRSVQFGGPACPSIKAALAGVYSAQ